MSDQDASDEASWDQIAALEAFDAKFKPEDFVGVAHALRLPEEPDTLAWLRELLLPEFRFFVESCSGQKLSREDRIAWLEKLRTAADDLDGLLEPGGARSNLRRFWISELAGDQFRKKLRALAGEAEMQIRRLQSAPRGRVGRRPLEAFRQLGDDLIRVFEKTTRKTAEEPDFSRFYRFAAAVCRCLHDSAPEVDGEIPRSPRALRDGLREIWKSVTKKQNEKPLPIKYQ